MTIRKESIFTYIKAGIPKHELENLKRVIEEEKIHAISKTITGNPIPAVAVVVFGEKMGTLLLTRRSPRDFPWPNAYMLGVAGKMDPEDKDILNTVYRELKEELYSDQVGDKDLIDGTLSIHVYTPKGPKEYLLETESGWIRFAVHIIGLEMDTLLINDAKVWYNKDEITEINEIDLEVLMTYMGDLDNLVPPFRDALPNVIATSLNLL